MEVTKFILENNLSLLEKFTVVDIGARGNNLGLFRILGRILEYLGFEPEENECERLNRVSNGGEWKIRYYPKALSGKKEKRSFFLTNDEACSSLLKPSTEISDYLNLTDKLTIKRELVIETTTLDTWKEEEWIVNVDYVKIDVQGAELEILKSGTKVLSDAIAVYCEVEFVEVYEGQPLFHDVDEFMKQNDFFLYDLKKVKSKRKCGGDNLVSNGQLVWGDAIYLKNIAKKLIVGDERWNYINILKYIIICEYFNIMDYAIYLIDKFSCSKFIKSDVYNESLLSIKEQIQMHYETKATLSRGERFFASLLRLKRVKAGLNRALRISKMLEQTNLTAHNKYFWRE